jgi:hypothetical protein
MFLFPVPAKAWVKGLSWRMCFKWFGSFVNVREAKLGIIPKYWGKAKLQKGKNRRSAELQGVEKLK